MKDRFQMPFRYITKEIPATSEEIAARIRDQDERAASIRGTASDSPEWSNYRSHRGLIMVKRE